MQSTLFKIMVRLLLLKEVLSSSSSIFTHSNVSYTLICYTSLLDRVTLLFIDYIFSLSCSNEHANTTRISDSHLITNDSKSARMLESVCSLGIFKTDSEKHPPTPTPLTIMQSTPYGQKCSPLHQQGLVDIAFKHIDLSLLCNFHSSCKLSHKILE